jgi:hypothetical protein
MDEKIVIGGLLAQNEDPTLDISIQKGKHNLRKKKLDLFTLKLKKAQTKIDTHSHSPQDLRLS